MHALIYTQPVSLDKEEKYVSKVAEPVNEARVLVEQGLNTSVMLTTLNTSENVNGVISRAYVKTSLKC